MATKAITEKQVRQILHLLSAGMSQCETARRVGFSRTVITKVIKADAAGKIYRPRCKVSAFAAIEKIIEANKEGDVVYPTMRSKIARCPTCGAMAAQPCLFCQLKRLS